MSNQHNNSLSLKFCEYCMNIMDVYSFEDQLHFVCSIPCKQSKLKSEQEQEAYDMSDEPILLSKRLIDNCDTKNIPNINTVHDQTLLRVLKHCNVCNKITSFVLYKHHDSKMDNKLICIECQN